MTSLGGPREGVCRVHQFTVINEQPLETRSEKDLGVMPWTALIATVEKAGGSRPTYDLFDIPRPDGTITRYRAVDVDAAP
jgi:hypothetical protein